MGLEENRANEWEQDGSHRELVAAGQVTLTLPKNLMTFASALLSLNFRVVDEETRPAVRFKREGHVVLSAA